MLHTYFENPKQVVFADPDNPGEWICGIAYKTEIICACCGGIFNIGEVNVQALEDGVKNPIYVYETWNDIAHEIVGGEWPEGLAIDEESGDLVEVLTEDDYVQMTLECEAECAALGIEFEKNSADA